MLNALGRKLLTIITTLADEYKALATTTRCLCPPDKLMPLSPIRLKSPAGMSSMSGLRAQASKTKS